jgi:hypothetical protein
MKRKRFTNEAATDAVIGVLSLELGFYATQSCVPGGAAVLGTES